VTGEQTREHADERRLARTVVPDEGHDLACVHREIDVGEGAHGAEPAGDPAQFENRSGHLPLRRRRHPSNLEERRSAGTPTARHSATRSGRQMSAIVYRPVDTMILSMSSGITSTGSSTTLGTPSTSSHAVGSRPAASDL